jgi:hypothetical protein
VNNIAKEGWDYAESLKPGSYFDGVKNEAERRGYEYRSAEWKEFVHGARAAMPYSIDTTRDGYIIRLNY